MGVRPVGSSNAVSDVFFQAGAEKTRDTQQNTNIDRITLEFISDGDIAIQLQ